MGVLSVSCTDYQPRAIQITEETWTDLLQGEWLVEFMAPWCPACRNFQPTWDGFAQKWSRDLDIKVGSIDVTASPGLSGRFLITALPSIYHVKDGIFRQYSGGRQETDLITYIDDKKWIDTQPVSKWVAPDSLQMGAVGLFFKFAMQIRSFYSLMTDTYGIPEWGCYIIFASITIVAGLVLGLLLVCICDFVGPNRQPPIPQSLMQPDRDKEGDLIDDTQPSDGDTKVRRRAVRKDGDGNGEADTHGGAEDDGNSEEDEDDDKTSDNNDKKSK